MSEGRLAPKDNAKFAHETAHAIIKNSRILDGAIATQGGEDAISGVNRFEGLANVMACVTTTSGRLFGGSPLD